MVLLVRRWSLWRDAPLSAKTKSSQDRQQVGVGVSMSLRACCEGGASFLTTPNTLCHIMLSKGPGKIVKPLQEKLGPERSADPGKLTP